MREVVGVDIYILARIPVVADICSWQLPVRVAAGTMAPEAAWLAAIPGANTAHTQIRVGAGEPDSAELINTNTNTNTANITTTTTTNNNNMTKMMKMHDIMILFVCWSETGFAGEYIL